MDWTQTKEKLKTAIEQAVKLEIKTKVGDGGANEKEMATTIDLLAGDITNQLDREFVVGELQGLRAFHETQVLKGQQIIKDNLDALKALWTLVRDASKDN